MKSKRCAKCGKAKPLDAFNRDNRLKSGLRSWCRACDAEYQAQLRAERPIYTCKRLPITRDAAYYRKWHEEHPTAKRWVRLKYNYDMAREDWEVRMIAQRGLCAGPGCGAVPTDVDHNHACCSAYPTCGRCVRGLLCVSCNLNDVLATT